MTNFRQYFVLPALPIAAFLVCTISLQTKKTIWVDECYTYYGITHNTWGEFVDSICSGINFSPPLYFFLNWIIQLAFHLPIEVLRIESALWISLGSFLIFSRCTKHFGFASAFLGCTLVLLQSNLLSEQALEGRHYGMFFACSAWTFFLFPLNQKFNSKRHKTLYFLAHLAFCLTHYLGIVFSALTAITRFWFQRKKGLKESLPIAEVCSCVVAIPVYLILLETQSSHLGNWARPNNLSSLLEIYFGSLSPLTLTIPILLSLFFVKFWKKTSSKSGMPLIIVIAFIWFSTPLIFWIISHVSTFNLFKDRYFIPKEAAVMVLISYFFHRIIPMFGTSKSSLSSRVLSLGGTVLVCISLFLLSSKRMLFGFDPSRDYHHWLMVDESIMHSCEPKIYSGDHLYFPNLLGAPSKAKAESYLLLQNNNLGSVYTSYSNAVSTIHSSELSKHGSFILVHEKPWSDLASTPKFLSFRNLASKTINPHSNQWAHRLQLKNTSK
jgi:hypothetical protein